MLARALALISRSGPVCCVPASSGVGALLPDPAVPVRVMASPLLSTLGEGGSRVGQHLQVAGGPEGALASWRGLALPTPG